MLNGPASHHFTIISPISRKYHCENFSNSYTHHIFFKIVSFSIQSADFDYPTTIFAFFQGKLLEIPDPRNEIYDVVSTCPRNYAMALRGSGKFSNKIVICDHPTIVKVFMPNIFDIIWHRWPVNMGNINKY